MLKKDLLFIAVALMPFLQCSIFAQSGKPVEQRVQELEEQNKKLKISGYIQAQFLNAEENGAKTYSGGNFPSESHDIFMVRRGRLKAEYKYDILNAVLQFDATEKGISIKDAYLDVKDPWIDVFSLKGGLFKVPMTNEILYSSSERLSPERARMAQTLIPGERDLGAMLTIRAPKKHFLNPVSLNIALLSGNGINPENDNQKNIAVRLYYNNNFGNLNLGIGGSTYQGGVYQGDSLVYKMEGSKFVVDNAISNKGQQAERSYFAGELLLGYKSFIGKTTLNGEFWTGSQPASASSSESPKSSTLPAVPTYIRPFQGMLAVLSHEITNTNLTAAVKYDMYDPNTKVSGNEIGIRDTYTSATDLSYTTIGAGLIYEPVKNLRLTVWYDMVGNEKTDAITTYVEDLKDNVLTVRIQLKF